MQKIRFLSVNGIQKLNTNRSPTMIGKAMVDYADPSTRRTNKILGVTLHCKIKADKSVLWDRLEES